MWFYRRAFTRSRKIFTVSEFSRTRIAHYSRNKVPVIVTHSAIRWGAAGFTAVGSSRPCIPGKKENIILFIGNIKKHKGLSILIEAFLQARHEGLEYKLVIVGSRENFRSADSDSSSQSIPFDPGLVEFTGFLSDEKLLMLLGEASLLVQPSLYEGFCLPPLEAMTAGTPVLISDIPVLREIYQEYPEQELGQGFPVHWFRAGDVQDLKQKLLALLHNKQLKEITLPEKLKNLYTFEKTSRTILTHLEEK
jgi:glycosyltransferase involved in cell wall biosynthesis